MHKISEWEDKRHYNVEFLQIKLENGFVTRVMGYEKDSRNVVMWDKNGHAFFVVNPTEFSFLKYDDESLSLSYIDVHNLVFMVQTELDMKW